MSFDFELLLVILTVVTGITWLVDKFYLAKQRLVAATAEGKEPKEPALVEFSRFLFPVVIIVLVLRSFLAEPFKIPSGSMLPTLEVGDFILVNKFAYGLRLPVAHSRILDLGSPHRGDVIVFRYPQNPDVDYIKRVVGIPGDEIGYYNKVLYINGKPASQELLGAYTEDMAHNNRLLENLAGVEHEILIDSIRPSPDFVLRVPEHKYFVLGDNRDNSRDSRFWGFVPEENLVGEAFLIWMNWDCSFADMFKWECKMPVWHRIGDVIE